MQTRCMKHQIGYNFGTQKFENRKTTCNTSSVFNGNGSAKRNMDRGSKKMSWVKKVISNEGDQV